jgi:hypothetical protein
MAFQVNAVLTTPLLGATAVAALVFVIVGWTGIGVVLTIAHEGGHMAMGVVTGHRIYSFEVKDHTAGVTSLTNKGWGPGRVLTGAAGYTAPPLLGLGGAALLDAGAVRPLLWTVVVLLVLALVKAEKEWTTFVVLLSGAAIGYAAIYGSPVLQAALAAGVVWIMLFGGVRDAVESGTGNTSDAAHLARDTLIPRAAWKAAFIVVALVCLWNGFLLLAP